MKYQECFWHARFLRTFGFKPKATPLCLALATDGIFESAKGSQRLRNFVVKLPFEPEHPLAPYFDSVSLVSFPLSAVLCG
jgi:hypothetical protein